ncbi:UNVERIFIED_CONTAM: hypothetical protein FKN15_006240 [Acipenser sinensis]
MPNRFSPHLSNSPHGSGKPKVLWVSSDPTTKPVSFFTQELESGCHRDTDLWTKARPAATPVVWPGACGLACKLPESYVVLRRCSSGGCMVSLQSVKKRSADGTRFGVQCVFVFALPSQRTGGSGELS